MSELELHSYLPHLSEETLKEFTEWCVIEQATEAGFELIVDKSKLTNLAPAYYIEELVDQFVQATRNSIAGGMAILVVDFISLYVKYLAPKGEKNMLPIDEKLAQVAQEQFDKLCEIAQKYGVDLKV
jgi:hypothetical protein